MNTNKKKPNIVFILSDDQGAWALHSAGCTDLSTPNLDTLAEKGTRFDNFFCVSPVCSPARASILTGTIPSVHGVQDWLRSGNITLSEHPELKSDSRYADEKQAIPFLQELTAYTDVLKSNGYRCGLSGKWHMGDSMHPQHGFTDWFTIAKGGCPYFAPDVIENGKLETKSEYITDLITDHAIKDIEAYAQTDDPFYLSVHYTAPHSPWTAKNHKKEFLDLYKDCAFDSVPNEPLHPWLTPAAPYKSGEAGRRENLTGYFAAISAMDAGIGEIMEKLEEQKLLDNTIVIFTADNGMNMGHHGVWGKGNGTFPQNMYDSSVKVPFIVYWKDHTPSNMVEKAMCSHYDVFPTFLDLLQQQKPCTCQKLPGKSFAEIFQNKPITEENRKVVIFDEYGPVRMIRDQEHKYVMRIPYGPDELYDLVKDPNERINLIDDPDYNEVKRNLRTSLIDWFNTYVDPKKDASKECNTGYGQLLEVGSRSKGEYVFSEEGSYRKAISHAIDTLKKPDGQQP